MTDPALLAEYERRFRADPDFWNYETSAYERAKRAATLEAAGSERKRATLELGCANGVLAEELAVKTASLIAVEATPTAAAAAAARLEPYAGASVIQGLVPAAVPGGPYDLVVASEILYYLDESSYRATLEQFDDWLAPDGRLVAVHWRPNSPERPRTAEQTHADLRALPFLTSIAERPTADYLLDVLVRA